MSPTLPPECRLPEPLRALGDRYDAPPEVALAYVAGVGWRALLLRSLRSLREAAAGAREAVEPVAES